MQWNTTLTFIGPIDCPTSSSTNSQYATCWNTVWTDTTNCDPAVENTDGDRLFCAATGSDFASIFKTAFMQLFKNSKFIRIP
jgi:hypothetical protein